MIKVGRIWPGNTTITLQTKPLHPEEETHSTNSPMTFKVIFKQPSLSLSLSPTPPPPSEMIAKLEMTLSNAQQNKDQKTIGATIIIKQQRHTHRLRTLNRSNWGFKLILLAKSSP